MSVSNSARAGTEGSSRKELVRTPAVGNWLLAFGVWGTLVGVLNLFGAAYRARRRASPCLAVRPLHGLHRWRVIERVLLVDEPRALLG